VSKPKAKATKPVLTDDERAALEERLAKRGALERAAREAKWAATTDEQLLRMRLDESREACDPMLALFLAAAVPMWIDQMKGWDRKRIERTAHELTDTVTSSQGIAAMVDPDARGTERKGDLAKAFNAVAQGLACLAFCPGGIVFGGHHWEVTA